MNDESMLGCTYVHATIQLFNDLMKKTNNNI